MPAVAVNPAHVPPPIAIPVAGVDDLPAWQVKRVLGTTPWRIWIRLLWCRDLSGRTFITNKTISAKLGIPLSRVRRAMQRLKLAGLVEGLGYVLARGGRRLARRVLGDYRGGELRVPERVLDALGTLTLHGGDRRSKAWRDPRGSTLSPDQDAQTPSTKMRRPPAPSASEMSSDSRDVSRVVQAPIRSGVEGISSSKEDGADEPRNLISFRRKSVAKELSDREVKEIETLTRPGGGLIPHHPTPKNMNVPKLPAPPLLPDDAGEFELANRLVRAYCGAVDSRYGGECMVLRNTDLRRSRYFKRLVAAAEELLDHEIAPAAWAAFSVDVWRNYSGGRSAKKKPPPLDWVFSVARIHQRKGWFRRESGSYSGGRLLYAEEHKELLRRYQAVTRLQYRKLRKLELEGQLTVAGATRTIKGLMDEWFPGGGYAAWAKAARKKGKADKEKLRQLVADGEFVW